MATNTSVENVMRELDALDAAYAPAWIAEMVRHRADSETSRPARKKATRR